jgi:ATP-dependent helicase Lhr and Lhr-like helicase
MKHPFVQISVTLRNWFKDQSWQPFKFQQQVWQAFARQQSGLIHATTGSGKTYAAWFAVLNQTLLAQEPCASDKKTTAAKTTKSGLRVLWITPMRALATDTAKALAAPLEQLDLNWTVGLRTGDTKASERSKQDKHLPHALVTTPESLCLMLTRADMQQKMAQLDLVVVDEWHELMGNKRGVQVQLALARLRLWRPELSVWGLSATLGNLDHAMQVLLNHPAGVLVQGLEPKKIAIDVLLPEACERFPWSGHLGLRMLPLVVKEIESSNNTLVFTNTRSQSEIWYNALLDARPDWAGLIALHHGSLDRAVRDWVEAGLKAGSLKAVVCTSSLDLGVDFSPVERVLQIGSVKGVSRALQRAGRSGHSPGQVSRLSLVPTNALELIEGAALADAMDTRKLEPRLSPEQPMDVLIQHVVTIALGAGFIADELFLEVQSTWAYRNLTQQQWQWALGFAGHGGAALTAYPEYQRTVVDDQGMVRVIDPLIAKRHRMSIGTIVSDATMQVKYLSGAKVGTIEEGFISRLKKGDYFMFGGKLLELIRTYEMTAFVKRATGTRPAIPRWNGGKMPLSSELANAFLARLEQAKNGLFDGPAMQAVRPLLELQAQWSAIPDSNTLLIEALQSKEGTHLFVYPFAGRNVHIGLSSLLAWRLGQVSEATFSIAVNDYGFELLSAQPIVVDGQLHKYLTESHNLIDDIEKSLNASELAARRFREIARISGLIFQGYPGAPKSNRQLQASSGLFYEVFKKYDEQNQLLAQAQREVLSLELDAMRLSETMLELKPKKLLLQAIEHPTPFAFALMVERLREKVTTEKLNDRIARMVRDLEKAATP